MGEGGYVEITARLVAAILEGRVNKDDVMFALAPRLLSGNITTYTNPSHCTHTHDGR